jgi:hypothetical protein
MAEHGDEIDYGGYTRCYHDSQLDLIIPNNNNYYWCDKSKQVTYK